MNTMTAPATPEFEVVPAAEGTGYNVTVNGHTLTDFFGRPRRFATRNSARKAITRVRRPPGDRHR